jgi:tripartite-type tricarboxylate transporter receptor subunit TctC
LKAACTIALAAVLAAGSVSAQSYPERPLRFVIPFPPGGGADNLARIVGVSAAEMLGQQIVIDNRAGAGGNIAAEVVANAAPDGYTLLQANVSHAISTSLYRKLNYDLLRVFVPVTQLASIPFVLAVNPRLNVSSVKELITRAKARPGDLAYASSGAGGPSHLAMELFKSMAGVDIVRIPYKGTGPAVNALIGGQVQLVITGPSAVAPHVKSGKLRALAVASAQPSVLAPELPTVSASGLPGYDASSTAGLFAPARTPVSMVNQLNQEVVRIINRPEVKTRFLNAGLETVGNTPAQFAAMIKSDMAKWGKVIKDAGIREE